uniref:ATP-dependent RNA helicase TDRD9 n=1 Tax=Podarcis muralis TaxID=64176 RepID=UPI0010A0491B|nr:ATP-dependent RNA helicase TDRD9 [Podarcis muralis]
MLRKLTLDQISDWFTIGKAVSGVEFLGGQPQAGGPAHSPGGSAKEQAPSANAARQSAGVEYVERYRQLESDELDASDSSWPPCEPAPLQPPQRESSPATCMPVSNYKYPDLPVSRYREEMISLIESNSVLIVRGSTGSGKSTQLPQFVLDHCVQRSTYCNIVVTQPRKIGASSIARWISKQRAWPLGELVGYQVGLEKVASKDTRLIYMTTGVLLQKIVGSKSLSEFTHVFIDEVHERTEEMDFLLLVVRKLLRTNSRFVKVILMSATINCQEFADYFAIPVRNRLYPAYVFEVEGKPHAIEEYYLDDLRPILSHIRIPIQVTEDPVIPEEMYRAAVSLIQWFDELEMKESRNPHAEIQSLDFMTERGSVLAFLPGLAEINRMHELLTIMAHKRLQVYPLHSSVTLEEQNNVFLAPVPGYRKIILSTNIAESSVTVPDVKYVIDFCLTKNLVCDEETNYQSLRLCWASKSSSNQRRGRAGRVSKGYCYRLVYKDFWENCIPETTLPEMMRRPLESTVLKVKLLDMGEPRALLATALSPPSISDIERTVLHLKEIGALAVHSEAKNPYDGELTFLGRVLAQLPVNQHLGKLMVLGHVFGCLEECIIIAAALSLNNFFVIPFRQHLDGYRNKRHFSGNSKSDCIALLDAFKEWQESKKKGKLRHPKDELDWGRSNYIHIKRIREVAELYEELKKRMGVFNMEVNPHPPAMDQDHVYKQRFILQVVMAGAFYPNYFTLAEHDEEIAVREMSGKDPKTTIMSFLSLSLPSRAVLVEKESVNSVVVVDAPEDSFQQMLVAASVTVNATGSTMLLRETSLMPHIPGLPALLAMLFAPVIDLRVDESRNRYIGVLCGLGWNYSLGVPILSDHDMEFMFDVKIDADDITQINIIRIAINKLVSDGPNGLMHFGQERIAQLQDATRQKLLGLICKSKPREVVPPKFYPKPYEWSQPQSNIVIDQSEPQDARARTDSLYQLHKLILLNA